LELNDELFWLWCTDFAGLSVMGAVIDNNFTSCSERSEPAHFVLYYGQQLIKSWGYLEDAYLLAHLLALLLTQLFVVTSVKLGIFTPIFRRS
jgi:hypothetical protein